MSFSRLCVFICLVLSTLHAENSFVVNNKKIGIETILPGQNWKLIEHNSKKANISIYISPNGARFTLMLFDISIYQNMEQRSQELMNNTSQVYRKISMKNSILDKKKVEELIYSSEEFYTIEIGRKEEDTYIIIQLTTYFANWQNPEKYLAWENVFKQLKWRERQRKNQLLDNTSYAEIIKLRNKLQKSKITIKQHNVRILIKKSKIMIKDVLFIEAKEKLEEFFLYTSLSISKIKKIQNSKIPMQWSIEYNAVFGLKKIRIKMQLKKGKRIALKFYATTKKNTSINTVVFPSRFTSNTEYKFTFLYPLKEQLITNYYSKQKIVANQNTNKCTYKIKVKTPQPRSFNFAVGNIKHTSHNINSKNKLVLVNVKLSKKFLDIFLQHLKKIEHMMLNKVFFDIIIVNTPKINMHMKSNYNFLYLSISNEGKFAIKNLGRAIASMWLDKHSKQIKMGLANYAQILAMGKEKYQNSLLSIKKLYDKLLLKKEYAIANPNCLQTPKVALYKIPLILAMLRKHSKTFKNDWKNIVSSNKNITSENINTIFNSSKKPNFFQQWLFRSGFPDIKTKWIQKDINIFITMKQLQNTSPFKIKGHIEIITASKKYNVFIQMDKQSQTWIIASPEKAQSLSLKLY